MGTWGSRFLGIAAASVCWAITAPAAHATPADLPARTSRPAVATDAAWAKVTAGSGDAKVVRDPDVFTVGDQSWVVNTETVGGVGLAILRTCSRHSCIRTELPTPLSVGENGSAKAISGTGPDDIWAVGSTYEEFKNVATMWHFDGTSWEQSRLALGDIVLTDVLAVVPGEAWALGRNVFNDTLRDGVYHYAAGRWREVNSIAEPEFPAPCAGELAQTFWESFQIVAGAPVISGRCGPDSQSQFVVIKGSADGSWRRIERGLPHAAWDKSKAVAGQLWLFGRNYDDLHPVIARLAYGRWLPVSAAGLPVAMELDEVGGTHVDNLWIVGSTSPTFGTGPTTSASWKWNGSGWDKVEVPRAAPGSRLTGISVSGPRERPFAVGIDTKKPASKETIVFTGR